MLFFSKVLFFPFWRSFIMPADLSVLSWCRSLLMSILAIITVVPTALAAASSYKYPYHIKVFFGSPPTRYYERDIVKAEDVVIIGGVVSIDNPLYSNGGDVVIYAGKLIISAPIDTRVYIDHGGSPDADPYFGETTASCKDIKHWFGGAPSLIEAYRDFYLKTDELWSDSSKGYALLVNTVFPEVPSGRTGCANPGGASAIDVVDDRNINWDGLKSGSITIFAHEIVWCSACPKNPSGWSGEKPEVPERTVNSSVEHSFLVTKGLRGSRGALRLWGCAYGIALDPGCSNGPKISVRDAGSRGGDAGSVSITFVDNQAAFDAETQAHEIRDRTNTRGGQPGAHEALITTCYTRFTAAPCAGIGALRGDRTFFPIETGTTLAAPAAGAPGTFDVSLQGNAAALATFASKLTSLESNKEKSHLATIFGAGDYNQALRYLSPIDQLETLLSDARMQLYRNVLGSVLNGPNYIAQPTSYDVLLTGLSGDNVVAPAAPLQSRQIMADLGNLSPYLAVRTLNSFFATARSGGAFNVQTEDVIDRFESLDTRIALRDIRTGLIELQVEGYDNREALFKYLSDQRNEWFLDKLIELRTQIDRTQNIILQQMASISEAVTLIKQVSDLGASIASAYTTGNYLAIPASIGRMGEDLSRLDEIIRLRADAEALRAYYRDLSALYAQFLASLREEKLRLAQGRNVTVSKLLDAQKRYNAAVNASRLYFPDLLKLSLMNALAHGAAHDKAMLQHDLFPVEVLLHSYPDDIPIFIGFRQYNNTCDRSSEAISDILSGPKNKPVTCAMPELDGVSDHWLSVRQGQGNLGGLILYYFPRAVTAPQPMALHGLVTVGDLQWN